MANISQTLTTSPSRKAVMLTENFHPVFRSAAAFPSSLESPPVETTYLATQYDNAKKAV